MPAQSVRIILPGLSRADGLELTEYIDPESVSIEQPALSDGDHGDLGLVTAIVLLSIPALKGFIAYLARRHQGKSFEQKIEIERPDGTVERHVLKYRESSGEPVDTALAKELASTSGFPLDELLKGTA